MDSRLFTAKPTKWLCGTVKAEYTIRDGYVNRFTPRPKLAPVRDQVLPRIISLLAIVDWSGMGWPVTDHKGPKSTVGENNRFDEIIVVHSRYSSL